MYNLTLNHSFLTMEQLSRRLQSESRRSGVHLRAPESTFACSNWLQPWAGGVMGPWYRCAHTHVRFQPATWEPLLEWRRWVITWFTMLEVTGDELLLIIIHLKFLDLLLKLIKFNFIIILFMIITHSYSSLLLRLYS